MLFIEESKEKVVELFRTLFRFYRKEGNAGLDTAVILAVAKEENMPLRSTLEDLKYLWHGYESVLIEIQQRQAQTRGSE